MGASQGGNMLELYWGSGSPYAWRVMLALEVKKLPYTSHLLEFSKKQTKTPEFLALNPRGKVPLLKDGDFALGESLAIIAYLDRKTPEPPLFGRNAAEAGMTWRSISETTSYLEPLATRIVGPLFFNKSAENSDDINAAIAPLQDELKGLEKSLSRSRWLVGESISAADIVVYPVIENLLRAAGKDAAKDFELGLVPFERYPALAGWRERIRALPGYDRTYPPHWRAAPPPAAVA
jgi:glutathione S-transferase